MSKKWLTIVVMVLAFSAEAYAEPVTLNFYGRQLNVAGENYLNGGPVSQQEFAPSFQSAEMINIAISYETNQPDTNPADPNSSHYRIGSLSVNIPEIGLTASRSSSSMQISSFNNTSNPDDQFFAIVSGVDSFSNSVGLPNPTIFEVTLFGDTSMLADDLLPTSPLNWISGSAIFYFTDSAGATRAVFLHFSNASIQPAEPVTLNFYGGQWSVVGEYINGVRVPDGSQEFAPLFQGGETINVSISYETNQPDTNPADPNTGTYKIGSLSVNIPRIGLSAFRSSNSMQISSFNDTSNPDDQFFAYVSGVDSFANSVGLPSPVAFSVFIFGDTSMLANDQLPTSPLNWIHGDASFNFTDSAGVTRQVLLAYLPAASQPPPPILTGKGISNIDGVISPGEWDGAGHVDFVVNTPGGGTTPATLYVMNDNLNLYVALRFAQPIVDPGHSLIFEFDNNDNGVAENGDDAFGYNPDLGVIDDYRTDAPPCSPDAGQAGCAAYDIDDGGTKNGAAAFRNDGTFSVYEMSHPLNSGDVGHDFVLSAGQTVGFFLSLRMIGTGGQWPQDFGDTDFPGFRNFGHILIQPFASPVTLVDGNNVTLPINVSTSNSGPTPPSGFQLGNPPTYYDIGTTATYTPPVTVCIVYDPAPYPDPNSLHLLHYESNTWLDVTTSNDVTNHTICGQVDSLSPFLIAQKMDNPPVITAVSANPTVLWPPNNKMVDVSVNYNATDDWDQPVCQISSITSNEQLSSSDYAIVDAHHIKLRATRLGGGNGRTYTITISCTDTSGKSSEKTVNVSVPHDQGKK